MTAHRFARVAGSAAALAACATAPVPDGAPPPPPPGQIAYRVLVDRFENADPSNDRGGIAGGRLDHGFDPRRPGFYHGGDLAGVTARLGYVQDLGATAIQLGPLLGALPVAGPPGKETASHHGLWLTDLTRIDPHLGTMADLRALTAAARARGMKVYADAVLNGTADLNRYEECADAPCLYRGEAAFPYTTRGDAFGAPINAGFEATDRRPDHRALTDPGWAYTPVMPDPDPRAPEWLTAPTHYHQRGPAGADGAARARGDLPGQDDLFTEHPVVANGLVAAYAALIDAGLDGLRILDADAVDPAFLKVFSDAMAERAHLDGRTALVWGQAATTDPDALARLTRAGGLPLVQDDAFAEAARAFVADADAAPLARVFRADPLYAGGADTARRLPTRLSGPGPGRLARAVARARPGAGPDDVLALTRLGTVLLLTARGTPVLYMGDEQGFGGASAQDMLESQVASYVAEDLLGTDATAADANFDRDHPYYRFTAGLARLRAREAALSRGAHATRLAEGGLYVFSRTLGIGGAGTEIVVAINASDEQADAFVPVDPRSDTFARLVGYCASGAAARGSYPVSVPPLDFVICKSEWGAEAE